jgi:chemotaxis protein methyltransferase CheR
MYFDRPTQERVVNRLATFLEPGGYLFVGHSERLAGINHNLKFIKPAIYQNESPTMPIRGGTHQWT